MHTNLFTHYVSKTSHFHIHTLDSLIDGHITKVAPVNAKLIHFSLVQLITEREFIIHSNIP